MEISVRLAEQLLRKVVESGKREQKKQTTATTATKATTCSSNNNNNNNNNNISRRSVELQPVLNHGYIIVEMDTLLLLVHIVTH
jgi:hypothetical protein